MNPVRIQVWDLPIRLFHWCLVALISAAIITGNIGGNAIEWHGRIGVTILGLLAFRIAWGFIGSTHARFANFFPTPTLIRNYLRRQWHGIGHNPIGALSVFALLTFSVLQVATGLLANDDIAFKGPLFELVGKEMSDLLTGIHILIIDILIALIALHLGAIIYYAHFKKNNLVKAMISGQKELDPIDSAKSLRTRGGGTRAVIAACVIALLTVYFGSGAWIPHITSQPLRAQPTPSW